MFFFYVDEGKRKRIRTHEYKQKKEIFSSHLSSSSRFVFRSVSVLK